ncbi:hypothetical protein O0L34_g11026 [Tuta absoluta]|nr:hypothetical protein O0L34_g11026 [Tuta absoluta]
MSGVICGGCKVVLDELLTFVLCKSDVLDEISIAQIVSSNFRADEVERSKDVLSDILGKSLPNRKGDKKVRRTVEDIISAIKNAEPNSLPTFAAKDLHRLPPVSFDYVDVTKILKDINGFREELGLFKTRFTEVKDTQQLQEDICNIRQLLELQTLVRVEEGNLDNGLEGKSSKIPNSKPAQTKKTVAEGASPSSTFGTRNSTAQPTQQGSRHPASSGVGSGGGSSSGTYNGAGTRAPTPRPEGWSEGAPKKKPKQNKKKLTAADKIDNEGFTTVSYKKSKLKCKRGTAPLTSEKIRVLPQVVDIFVSRLHPDVQPSDLEEFLVEKGERPLSVQSLGLQSGSRKFSSFKVTFLKDQSDTVLSDAFWPQNIEFRLFQPRYKWQPKYRSILNSTARTLI